MRSTDFLRGRGDCKGERGVPLYPFTCPEATFRHEHKVNGTHLPSRIFPSPQPSPRGRGRKPGVDTVNVFNLVNHGCLVFPHDNHSDIFVPPWRRACSEGVESPLKSVSRRPDGKVRPPGMAD